MKISKKNGFTLAELLIVVAIIGVLVGISIPIFSNLLEKGRDAASVANIRSAYSQAVAEYITCTFSDNHMDDLVHSYAIKDNKNNVTRTINFRNGRIVQVCIFGVDITSKKNNDWSGLAKDLPFHDTMSTGNMKDKQYGDIGVAKKVQYIVFNFDDNGAGQGASRTGENWNDKDAAGMVTSVVIVY